MTLAARIEESGDRYNARPIGIFDSGVGGLTVARAIRQALPSENLFYVADTDNAPYGNKSAAFIRERAVRISEQLLADNAKAIVVACNSATVSAIRDLRAKFELPIVGVEPGIKPAALTSRSGRIAVLATERTIESDSLVELTKRVANGVQVFFQPCPGLADLIEHGSLEAPELQQLLASWLNPLLVKGVDTLVLGCTHYAFVLPLIRRIAGEKVSIIDTASAVGQQLTRRLAAAGLLHEGQHQGSMQMRFGSSNPAVGESLKTLWGEAATLIPTEL